MESVCSVSWNRKSLKATVHLPSSKSISNRILIMQALCGKKFPVKNLSEADDTKLLLRLLSSGEKILDAGNAGTCFRFLTAYLAQKNGERILTGSDRMKQRPIGELVDALHRLGGEIKHVDKENFPPLAIQGKKLIGNELEIDSSQSSQFVSSLLLIAPYVEGGLKLKLTGKESSSPYIDMTLKLMAHFGIKVLKKNNTIEISQQQYAPEKYSVEPDWSSASFWYGMAALSDDAEILFPQLTSESIQGDSVIAELMKTFHVETGFISESTVISHHKKPVSRKHSFNFSKCPDLAPVFFVLCSALGIEAKFSGLKNLSIKESNRTEALKTELEKCGAMIIKENEDEFRIMPHPLPPFAEGRERSFETYSDHRLAMAFAMLAIPFGKVEIKNPAVVSKSYPGFWNDLRSAGFEITFA